MGLISENKELQMKIDDVNHLEKKVELGEKEVQYMKNRLEDLTECVRSKDAMIVNLQSMEGDSIVPGMENLKEENIQLKNRVTDLTKCINIKEEKIENLENQDDDHDHDDSSTIERLREERSYILEVLATKELEMESMSNEINDLKRKVEYVSETGL